MPPPVDLVQRFLPVGGEFDSFWGCQIMKITIIRELLKCTYESKEDLAKSLHGYDYGVDAGPSDYPDQVHWKYEKAIADNLDIIQNKKILDIGSGLGDFGLFCLEDGAEQVIGIDSRMIFYTGMRRFLKTHPEYNHYYPWHGDLYNLPKKIDGDTILCLGVFCHIHNHIEFLKELHNLSATHLILGVPVLIDDDLSSQEYGKTGILVWRHQTLKQHPRGGIDGDKEVAFTAFPNRKFVTDALAYTGWEIETSFDFQEHPVDGLEETIREGRYLILRCKKI